MPVFKQYTESSYKWGIWKTSESLEELLALLPHKEKYEEGIGKFTAVSRKLEWLAVRVLLYTMLGEEKEIQRRALFGRRLFFHQYFTYQRLCSGPVR